jgi:hypothetical protein
MTTHATPSPVGLRARRLRRWRLWGGAAFVVLALLAVATTGGREGGLRVGVAYLCVGDACLQVGAGTTKMLDDMAAAWGPLYFRRSWNSDWTVAWRPFRVYLNYDATFWQHALIVPLWPLVLGSCAVWAWASGALAGLRWARTSHCAACGYDLRGVREQSGRRTCPECGQSGPA